MWVMFVEYFVEIILVEGLPSVEFESVFVSIVLLLMHLLPDLMQFLQCPRFLSVQDNVHPAFTYQLI